MRHNYLNKLFLRSNNDFKMVDGTEHKCRSCHKRFWVGIKLSFGARKKQHSEDLLDCFLNEVIFYFKCPYCKSDTETGFIFHRNQPKIEQTVRSPNYIG